MTSTSPAALLLVLVSAFTPCACSSPEGVERFGAPLAATPGARVTVAQLLAAPERYDGAELTLEGTVGDVCPKKGCWMTLGDGAREMRVTFQDYGFFVPLDARGARVRAQGRFAISEVPVAEARHYLEDAGRLDEAAALVEPVRSFTFVATGVELSR